MRRKLLTRAVLVNFNEDGLCQVNIILEARAGIEPSLLMLNMQQF